jgi:hypothetical protein
MKFRFYLSKTARWRVKETKTNPDYDHRARKDLSRAGDNSLTRLHCLAKSVSGNTAKLRRGAICQTVRGVELQRQQSGAIQVRIVPEPIVGFRLP